MSEAPVSYSQTGEDILVWEFFGKKSGGYFVEVGANDPVALSQTYFLEQQGWTGILVEPQEACCRKLRAQRLGSVVWQVACSAPEKRGEATFHIAANHVLSGLAPNPTDNSVTYLHTETVRVVTLDDILEAAGNPVVDFLSIDVEGFEMDVFRGLDFARRGPKLLLIEDHVHDLAKHRYLAEQGYEIVFRTGCNNWYVPVGTPFPRRTPGVRWKLFRKMTFLAVSCRRMRLALKQRHRAGRS